MSLSLSFTVMALSAMASAGKGIDFQPCPQLNQEIAALFDGVQLTPFECAKLSVPLDYTVSNSEPLALDLFRVPATEKPVLGSVLINFGGPGGTGAENLPVLANEAHANIGPQWNLISWDPRGTGNTIPFRCDVRGTTDSSTTAQKRDVGTLVSTNLTTVFENGGWNAAGQVAEFCSSQANETGALIGTAFVARDMLRIVDRLGEDGLLRYYGWSYGTALGSYFAAIFPERVGRMVLDANVAPQDYQAGHYGVYALDTDKAFAGFVETCFDAEDDCALYTYVKPSAVQDLLDAVNLAIRPLARNAPASMQAYNAYLAIKGPLLEPLYSPRQWAGFAITLVAWLNGTIPLPMDTSSAASLPTYGTAEGAVMGIRASDATFIANSSDQYLTQLEFQTQVSPGFSDIAYFALWVSAQWKMPAKERYWGDFKATTKTPILYVNGIADPVTPLANAYNASAGFKDSVVLPHNGYGHGVFVDPSECVAKHVRAYFKDATLPQGNITCEPDSSLLETWKATLQATEAATSSGGDDRSAAGNGTATPPAQGGASHNGLSGWLTVMILLGATTSYLL